MFEMLSGIHFLRPWWFLGLLPVVWFIWRAWQANKKQGAWHQVIDPKFRRLLLGENISSEPTLNEKLGYIGLAFLWFFTILALSGPWVKSVDVPAQKSQQGVVIVLDLSLSMLADDITPNRLARVKYTLTDLLKQNPDYAVGMVVYSGSAHTISPISEDNKTLLNLLPSLNPVVMPKFGSEPLLGMQQAEQLLKGANVTHGHIIWISDDIEKTQVSLMEDWIDSRPYSVSLLTVGTEKGGVVQIPTYGLLKDDQGNLILPAMPTERFAELVDDTNMQWQNLQIGADNSKNLLPQKLTADESQTNNNDDGVHHPLDIGIYLLFILIPMAAYMFRRGVLLSLMLVTLVPMALMVPQPAYANSVWSNLGDAFKSHDQQAYEAWEQQDYAKAEALFEDRQWRASALYREGRYAEAARLFASDKSAKGYFNQGNALAKDMQLDKAIEAYQQALLINPNMQQAKDNLNLVQQLKMVSQKANGNNLDGELPPNQSNPEANTQNNQAQPQNSLKKQSQNQNQSAANQGSSANQQGSSQADSNANGDQSDAQAGEDAQTAENGDTSNAQGAQASSQAGGKQTDTPNASQGKSDNANDLNASQSATANSASGEQGQQGKAGADGLAESQNEDGKGNSGENQQAQRAGKIADAESQGEANKNAQPLSEEELAQQNWLKQIPDQPGLFLKRKFEYQYQQNPGANNDNDKQW